MKLLLPLVGLLVCLAHLTTAFHSNHDMDLADKLRILLDRVDKDDDELITKQELTDFVTRSHTLVPRDIADELFELTDTDEDGGLSWEEHLDSTFDVQSAEDIPSQLEGTYEHKLATINKIRSDEELFEAADIDDDGELNKDEYLAFSMPENSEELIPLLLSHIVGGKDDDGDGLLTYEEFVSQPDAYQHLSPAKQWSEDRFDELLDLDDDGVLDAKEIERYALPRNLNAVLEEVDHLFEEADDDDDDILTFDEVLEYQKDFESSPLTDYGRHIKNIDNLRKEL